MTTRAENLLEGFKLGSLGARTHFVDPQQKDLEDSKPVKKTSRISFAHRGKQKSRSPEISDPPYFYWTEEDGWSYALEVYAEEDEFGLFFSGGKNLKITNGFLTPNDDQVSDAMWVMRAVSGLIFGYKDYLELFEQLVAAAEKKGSAGLIKSARFWFAKFEPNDSRYKSKFAKWLKQKKSQEL